MEKSRKPKIRFKGYNDDWEQRKLGELILEYKKTVDSSCTLPVLTSSKTEGVILQEEHFGRKQQHDITGYNVLPRSFCTYRNRSDGVDFTFNVNECCDMGIISKFYPVFCGNDNDTFFISLVLNNSDEVVHEIAFTCIGTGQKVLSFLDLQKMSIRVPKQSEQKKISIYFKQLDDLITLHQRKLDKLINVKKSMLEKMFPKQGSRVPEIRFSGFTHDWEQRKVTELGMIYIGLVTTMTSHYTNDGILLIRNSDIKDGRFEFGDNQIFLERSFAKANESRMHQLGDVITVHTGDVGTSAVITKNEVKSIGFATIVTRPNRAIINPYYLCTFLNTEKHKKWAVAISTGDGRTNYNLGDYLELIIPVPSINEQKEIALFIEKINTLITLHQRKLEKLKNIKKSMLEKMFI